MPAAAAQSSNELIANAVPRLIERFISLCHCFVEHKSGRIRRLSHWRTAVSFCWYPAEVLVSTFATFSKWNGRVVDTQAMLLLLLGGVVILVWRSFFSGYGSQKGKNLATKEDIDAITDKIENVKLLYAKQHGEFLEGLRSKQQLRMAALEKRLEAHQQAFTFWRKLMFEANSRAVITTVNDCQEWWERNCLYLSSDARAAFRQAYFAAADHPSFLAGTGGAIRKAGEAIVSGVELSTLGEREAEDVTDPVRRVR